jgi:hypothetical protein
MKRSPEPVDSPSVPGSTGHWNLKEKKFVKILILFSNKILSDKCTVARKRIS